MKKNKLKDVNNRRNFLRQVTAGAAVAGMGILGSSVPGVASPLQEIVHDDDDDPESWLKQITGKHRMVFDVIKPHQIFPFAWPRVFLITNEMTGTPAKENSAVVVLRHDAVPYALESKLWEKYKLGELFKADDHLTKAPAIRNPFWEPKPGEFKVPGLGPVQIGINELQSSGVIFCVCEMALTVYSAVAADMMKKDAAEVKKEWVAGILPGINLVPSGVWAVGRAQEKGCGYCYV